MPSKKIIKSFKDRYDAIAESDWFRETYHGHSIGEIIPVEYGGYEKVSRETVGELDMNEKDVIKETLKHISSVCFKILRVCNVMHMRAYQHDDSKLEEPEFETFLKYTPKLRDTTYGSDEYKEFLAEMKPALDHHYAANKHHPEHFENGVDDMTLIDIIEMLCDWWAATERHADGDIMNSIEINTERFGLSPQVASILKNTIELMQDPELGMHK